MTNNVTDTNVGKMTEEEAIAWFEDEVEGLRGDSKYKALLIVAIEALKFQQSLVMCGDCKYYICDNPYLPKDAHIMICDLCSAGRYRVLAESDGYCSDGERRGEE